VFERVHGNCGINIYKLNDGRIPIGIGSSAMTISDDDSDDIKKMRNV